MKMPREYTRIEGLGSGAGNIQAATRSRLYQAADHLMLVQSTGVTEEYRRIYYHDISLVTVLQTPRRTVLTLIFGVAFLLSLLLGFRSWIAAGVFATPFLVAFTVNLAKGPTCKCQVSTRVQSLDLPTPRRTGKVPILIAFLREKTPA
jgi:hypothetical protein